MVKEEAGGTHVSSHPPGAGDDHWGGAPCFPGESESGAGPELASPLTSLPRSREAGEQEEEDFREPGKEGSGPQPGHLAQQCPSPRAARAFYPRPCCLIVACEGWKGGPEGGGRLRTRRHRRERANTRGAPAAWAGFPRFNFSLACQIASASCQQEKRLAATRQKKGGRLRSLRDFQAHTRAANWGQVRSRPPMAATPRTCARKWGEEGGTGAQAGGGGGCTARPAWRGPSDGGAATSRPGAGKGAAGGRSSRGMACTGPTLGSRGGRRLSAPQQADGPGVEGRREDGGN